MTNPIVPTEQTLKRYNMTEEDWWYLWTKQSGLCAVCGNPPRTRLVIDHCHRSGRVRGLLCPLCNGKLGKIKDSSAWCRQAADYLDSPPDPRLPGREPPRTKRRRTRRKA